MVKAQDRSGQRIIPVTDMPYMPPTVVEHEDQPDGMTLITLDSDPDTNIEIYDADGRTPHLSGETPEWAE